MTPKPFFFCHSETGNKPRLVVRAEELISLRVILSAAKNPCDRCDRMRGFFASAQNDKQGFFDTRVIRHGNKVNLHERY